MEDLSIPSEDVHICPRREHNDLAPLRREVLHCYGVDFLSNKEVLEVFAAWEPKEVEWLDDSSCNLVFETEEAVQKAIRELAVAGDGLDALRNSPWTRTGPLSVGSKDEKKGKARRGGPKNFCFQLRVASEADRKDPTHSGHTDSIYYAHVKEQQAMQKQATELRRMKKRQRQMVHRHKEPTPSKTEAIVESEGISKNATTELAADSSDVSKVQTGSILSTRLASCGLLDPLLFLKAPAAQGTAGAAQGIQKSEEAAQPQDLKAMLKRAEAEYAAVLHPARKTSAKPARGREDGPSGRQREGTPGRPGGRDGMPAKGQQRGKKRRPVEQEPRPVSEAAPPQRKIELLPEVDAFLKKHGVRCKRFVLHRSFRSIKYAQQEAAKTKKNGPEAEQLRRSGVVLGQKNRRRICCVCLGSVHESQFFFHLSRSLYANRGLESRRTTGP
ncbi:unnamed protein product [Durusdinium trenchii]|uniref:Nuclear cap-binding protein subunit 3 n=1 Tax=Durusdinium trenchii TaxID=1381693 RepID=A0ABP0JB50_9DINO